MVQDKHPKGAIPDWIVMMTKSERHRLARKEKARNKRWAKIMAPVDKFWLEIKKIIRAEKNKMMYGKREKDRIDRFAYELIWWGKLIIIFLAFSYIFRG